MSAASGKLILVFAEGSGGDVYPNIAIGKALRERGHRVRFIANSYFETPVAKAGLEFISSGSAEDARKAAEDPDTWKRGKGIRKLFARAADAIPATYELIREQYVPGETIVVATFLAFGARVANEKLGIPLATVHPETVLLRSRNEQPGVNVPDRLLPLLRPLRQGLLSILDRHVFDPLVLPKLNRFRQALGLSPVSRILDGWVHSPELVIGLYPDWFVKPQPDWPPNTHLTGFPLTDLKDQVEVPGEVETFLKAGDAPIVFTLGSAIPMPRSFVQTSIETCRILGRRGIFLSPFAENIPENLPPPIAQFRFVPLSALLPRAAALVHHGGIGTMAQAFAAGIPQLVIPFNFDQPANAAHLRALAAGESIRLRDFRHPGATRKLRRLLTSAQVAEACRNLALRVAKMDCISETCRLIEQLGTPARDRAQAVSS
ncbi:MAG: glycosyl transferase [Bryobacterales bacterium]|nr:glycosyl transferase [Bryobacterales bacterium]